MTPKVHTWKHRYTAIQYMGSDTIVTTGQLCAKAGRGPSSASDQASNMQHAWVMSDTAPVWEQAKSKWLILVLDLHSADVKRRVQMLTGWTSEVMRVAGSVRLEEVPHCTGALQQHLALLE